MANDDLSMALLNLNVMDCEIKIAEGVIAYFGEMRPRTQRISKETDMALTNGKTEEKETRKVDFAYEGDRFVIPADMDLDEAERSIQRQRQEEDVDVSITEPMDAFPLVGANAAFFRNTVEQAKLSAIEKMESDTSDVAIRPDDLRIVAEGMVPHAKLINPEHGKKSLLDMEEEQHDPMTLAMAILSQKFSEAIIANVANPKVLTKVILKKMKPSGGGPPSMN